MRTVRRPSDLGHTIKHFRKKASLTQAALGAQHNLAQRLLDILATLDLEMVIRPRSKSGDDDLADMFL